MEYFGRDAKQRIYGLLRQINFDLRVAAGP